MSKDARNKMIALYHKKWESNDELKIGELEDEITDVSSELTEEESVELFDTISEMNKAYFEN